MTKRKMAKVKVMTPEFRVSYPNVFKAKRNDLNGQDEYSVVALFKKGTDISKLKEAAQKAITDTWGEDKTKWPANLRSPFRDQGEKKKEVNGKMVLPDGHEEGAIFLNLKDKMRPGVINGDKSTITDESEFYPGCWARAVVLAQAYDQAGNRGVSFKLQNLQKVKDGEPFSGRSKPEDDFEPVEGTTAVTSGTDLFN